jgi:hypothetical protein
MTEREPIADDLEELVTRCHRLLDEAEAAEPDIGPSAVVIRAIIEEEAASGNAPGIQAIRDDLIALATRTRGSAR